jgi:hypothetical protein
MAVPETLRWLLTVALAGATVFHLGRAVRPRLRHEHRIAESLHAVMGLAMVAMLWPFGRAVPVPAWLVVFAGSAGWFAAQASRAHKGRIVPIYFASAAAAMVWMSGTMPATLATGTMPPGGAMSGMAHSAGGQTLWAAAAIGGYLVAAGLCWLLGGLRLGALRTAAAPQHTAARCATHWPALCHGVMGLSMGLAVLTMV